MTEMPKLPVEVSAKIETTTRGSDTGTFVACGTGIALVTLGVFLATTSVAVTFPVIVYAVVAVGLLLPVAGIAGWFSSRNSRNTAEAPPTEITIGAGVVSLKTNRIETHRQLLNLVKLIQHRRELPAPYGLAGDAAKAYSDEEKQQYIKAQHQREAEHDARVLGTLTRAALPPAGGQSVSPEGLESPRRKGIIGPK